MRLTLRTMLAYIDDVLEPKDAEEIAKKIEESEFATNLLHRIKDVTKRLRLGAPSLTDRSAGLDPNTVAEYLDYTLPDDRVPDFEKVCLESNIHLAEVAACHEVRALLFGEPAEVDPAARERMYRLLDVLTAQEKLKSAPPKLPGADEREGDHPQKAQPGPPKPPLPEYLREAARKRRLWRTVAAIGALILILLVVLTATRQLEPGSRLGQLLGLGQAPAPIAHMPVDQAPKAASDQAGAFPPRTVVPTKEQSPAPIVPAVDNQGLAPKPVTQSIDAEDRPKPASEAPASPTAPAQVAPLPTATAGMKPLPGIEPGPINPLRVEAAGGAARMPTPAGPQKLPAVNEVPAKADAPEALAPSSRAEAAEAAPRAAPAAAPAEKPASFPPGEAAPLPIEQVAKFVPPPNAPPTVAPLAALLLRFDPESGTWQRVRPQATLTSQDRLLSLPNYRPPILMVGDVMVEMVDGTRVDLQPVDAQGVPGLAIDFGRVILRNQGKDKARMRIQMGERIGVITFGHADSAVALEVSRAGSHQADPETQPGPRVADLYVMTGRILWQEDAGREPVAVNAPVRLTLNDKPLEAIAVQQLPQWLSPEAVSQLDQRAAANLERELQVRPVALAG